MLWNKKRKSPAPEISEGERNLRECFVGVTTQNSPLLAGVMKIAAEHLSGHTDRVMIAPLTENERAYYAGAMAALKAVQDEIVERIRIGNE